MRIAIFHVTATFVLGGSESYVWALAHEMQQRGHQVTLYAGDVRSKNIRDDSVNLVLGEFTPRRYFHKLGGSRFAKLMERLTFAWGLRRHLKNNPVDIINIHKPYDAPFALWLKKKTGCKVIWRCHGTDFYPGFGHYIHAIDKIYCVSDYARQTLVDAYPVKADVIHTGVDTDFFVPVSHQSERPEILYFGRLEGWKGVRFLIDALGELQTQNWTMRILGDGSTKGELVQQAEKLGLQNKIIFEAATKDRTVIRQRLHAASVVVFPSLADETFSNAVLEAMACGKAIVASNAGGFIEALRHEDNALLVEAGNTEQLGKAIGCLLDDSTLRQRLGGNARFRCEQEFSAKCSFDKVEQSFTSLLEGVG